MSIGVFCFSPPEQLFVRERLDKCWPRNERPKTTWDVLDGAGSHSVYKRRSHCSPLQTVSSLNDSITTLKLAEDVWTPKGYTRAWNLRGWKGCWPRGLSVSTILHKSKSGTRIRCLATLAIAALTSTTTSRHPFPPTPIRSNRTNCPPPLLFFLFFLARLPGLYILEASHDYQFQSNLKLRWGGS